MKMLSSFSRILGIAIFGALTAATSLNAAAPVINSSLTESTIVNQPYSYTITSATDAPTAYAVTSLPAGLAKVGDTISGTPTQIGVFDIGLFVSNADGSDLQTLELTVNVTPAITSALSASVDEGDAFSYQITANNEPDAFFVMGLESFPGLSYDVSTGLISGIPTSGPISADLIIQATNNTAYATASTATSFVTLTVNEVTPVVTSATTAAGVVGNFFAYQITANNYSTGFTVSGLDVFPGLSLDSATGIISGTPTAAATGDVTITSVNPAGDATETLTLTITEAAAGPTITSAAVATATKDSFFFYIITATNDPISYAVTGALPAGLSRSGSVISGTPTETGVFSLVVYATNENGTGSNPLELTVAEPAPVITSQLTTAGEVNEELSYQITADNTPTSFVAYGLDAIPGLSFNGLTGLISGTPTASGDFDVTIVATNAAGSDTQLLRVIIIPETGLGDGPSVVVTTIDDIDATTNPVFEGDTESLTIVAEVEPDAGETLEAVFVRWNNPPSTASDVANILVEMLPVEPIPAVGPITFSGVVNVGFNPNNRELSAGAIDLEVIATQRNDTTDALSFGTSAPVMFEIAPLVEYLFPAKELTMKSISVGEVFASVKLSTNVFQSVSATISGVGVIDTILDDDASDNPNGIYNFQALTAVTYPDSYKIDVVATDTIGNTTKITRTIVIDNAPSTPVVSIASPTPGFSNEVFTPAIFTYEQNGAPEIAKDSEGVVQTTTYTYAINQITEGLGYYPRDATDVNIIYNFNTSNTSLSGAASISGNVIEDGRLPELQFPDSLSIVFTGVSSGYGSSGTGVVDSRSDPGEPAQIVIAPEFFKADADLVSFKIYVNGEDVTPGNGNLDATAGQIDSPVISYPASGSPAPGNYVVIAQVFDADGEVGTSLPLDFRVVPYQELDVNISRADTDAVNQGDEVTYYIDVDETDQVASVEIFDSKTGDSLGQAARVNVAGDVRYRFSNIYLQAGIFSIFAEVTTLNDQKVRSNSETVQVLYFNDLAANLTSPTVTEMEIFVGETVDFTGTASSTSGVVSFEWLVNNAVEESDTGTPYAFSRAFDAVGTYTIRGVATDNLSHQQGTDEEITITVVQPELSVVIAPSTTVTLTSGESLTFTATVTSDVDVASVIWYVNGIEFETDTTTPYSFEHTFASVGTSTVRAEALDILGTTESSPNTSVNALSPDPNVSDADFVADIYTRLLGRVPSAIESSEALAILNGTLDSRVEFITGIFEGDDLDSTIFVQMIYRTMTGEWPSQEELAESREAMTNSVASSASQTGFIAASATQTFEYDVNVGNTVTITVNADDTSSTPLSDATLTINDPSGNFVAYADDSFQGGSFTLDPSITFIPSQTGTYTATVGGWSTLQFGDFTITISSTGSGSVGSALSAQALVTYLIPEYEERFGTFLTDASDRYEANPFVTQVFKNKHGTQPSAQALARLGDALTGADYELTDGVTSPGYSGDVSAFVAGFATDNTLSGFNGPSGMPLTSSLFYARPNDATQNAALALLVSSLLGEDPTNALMATFSGGTISGTVRAILTDSRYYQHDANPSSVAGQVALYMAGFGIFDLDKNAPTADLDGDGFDNEAEFNAGTNPLNIGDHPPIAPLSTSAVLVQLLPEASNPVAILVEDTDGDGQSNLHEYALGGDPADASVMAVNEFSTIAPAAPGLNSIGVLRFVRIKDANAPADLTIVPQCSANLVDWDVVDSSHSEVMLAEDQSGLGDEYERVELRFEIDPGVTCNFVRISVNGE